MTDVPSGSRYDVSGNPEAQYVDAAQQVLVNLPGMTDLETLQIAEEAALASAYERLLCEVRVDTPLTCDLLRYIHGMIFGDLFPWAGRWRTVNISKPGAVWPTAAYLDESMATFQREVLSQHPSSGLNTDADFLTAVAAIQGEFLSIHPFREGNARTIKLATDLLAVQTGRPLLKYDQTEAGVQTYIAAASGALHRRDMTALMTLIGEALERSRGM